MPTVGRLTTPKKRQTNSFLSVLGNETAWLGLELDLGVVGGIRVVCNRILLERQRGLSQSQETKLVEHDAACPVSSGRATSGVCPRGAEETTG